MHSLLLALLLVARQMESGQAGKEFLVLREESLGYETTPLEREFADRAEAVWSRMQAHPEDLSPANLALLLQILFKADQAADGYRARLQSQAGDYGDEESMAYHVMDDLIEGIRVALAILEKGDRFPLREVPVELLQKVLVLRNANGGWSSPVWKRFYSRERTTFQAPPFTGFFEKLHDDMRHRIAAFPRGEDWQKRSIIGSISHDGRWNDAIARSLARGFLRDLLDDPDREIRLEALSEIERQGEENADLLFAALGHADIVTRRLAAFHLGRLAEDSLEPEFRQQVREAVQPMTQDPDPKNRDTAAEAIRQAER